MPKGIYARTPGQPRPTRRKTPVTLTCIHCGKRTAVVPSKGRRRFCNRSCYEGFTRGGNHPRYKGWTVNVHGYRVHNTQSLREYEHRVIAEKALGRKLKRSETVHHIDGNKLNNTNTNLLICSGSYHNWLHNHMSLLYAQEHFGTGYVTARTWEKVTNSDN